MFIKLSYREDFVVACQKIIIDKIGPSNVENVTIIDTKVTCDLFRCDRRRWHCPDIAYGSSPILFTETDTYNGNKTQCVILKEA